MPDAKALAALGFKPEDLPDRVVGLFPDNWPAFLLFEGMATQWRAGACGATGLDYNAIPVVSRALGLRASDRSRLFDDLRVMEAEALAVMAEVLADES